MKTELDLVPVACCTPVAAPDITRDQGAALASIFKALADPHRVLIVNLLANASDPVCVCDFQAHLGLAQATVSFHLKKLVDVGLLRRDQRGTWAYYSLDRQALDGLSVLFDREDVSW